MVRRRCQKLHSFAKSECVVNHDKLGSGGDEGADPENQDGGRG